MIELESIGIRGFKSFKDEQVLALPERPGLNRIIGKNNVNPELGPNATGKSTIGDALCWALFGWTIRGLRASDIITWDGEDVTKVWVKFRKEGKRFKISRTQSPNTLTLTEGDNEPEPIDQRKLEDLLGTNFETFLLTVIYGQFEKSFLDLGPTEKLARFTSVLTLDLWLKAADRAREHARIAEKELANANIELARLSGSKQSKSQNLAQLKQDLDTLELDIQRRKHQLNEKIADLEASTARRNQQISALNDELKETYEKRKHYSDILSDHRSRLQALDSTRYKLEAARDGAVKDLDKMIARRSKINSMGDSVVTCPTCLQVVGGDSRDKLETEIQRDILEQRRLVDSSHQQAEEAKQTADKARFETSEHQERLDRADKKARGLEDEIRSKQSKNQIDNDRLMDLTVERRKLDGEIQVLEAKITKEEEEIQALTRQENRLTLSKLDIEQAHLISGRWVDGFKQIRLDVIDDSLKELEIETSNALVEIGLVGWKIIFDTERLTKSNTVSKEFSVLISPPGIDRPIVWESWSGGETQRLKIAGSIGFSNMVQARTTFRSDFELWDEPTAHLSEEGVADLMNYLKNRAEAHRKKIYIIDHRTYSSGIFDDEILVTKEQSGSKIRRLNDNLARYDSMDGVDRLLRRR